MRRTFWPALICAVALMAPAAGAQAAARPHTAAAVSGLDRQFLKSSIQTDRAEISGGRLALTKSRNAAVRRLAARLIADHTTMLASAVALARSLGIAVPGTPSPTQMWAAEVLGTLSGRSFNFWFATQEVAGHVESIQLATTEVQGGTNASVRKAAATALPMLRLHLALARAAVKANPLTTDPATGLG